MEIITLQNINQYRKVLLVIKLHCQKNIILSVNSYHFIVYKIPFSSTFARRLLKLGSYKKPVNPITVVIKEFIFFW